MKHFSDASCETIMKAATAIDKAIDRLDELPESEHLADLINDLTGLVLRLDNIIKAEDF